MTEQTDFLRQQAERCRRLAMGLNDNRTVNTMLLMAADYEREASALEQPQMTMPPSAE